MKVLKFVLSAGSLDELVGLGTLTAHAARFLEEAGVADLNVIVACGTQACSLVIASTPPGPGHGASVPRRSRRRPAHSQTRLWA